MTQKIFEVKRVCEKAVPNVRNSIINIHLTGHILPEFLIKLSHSARINVSLTAAILFYEPEEMDRILNVLARVEHFNFCPFDTNTRLSSLRIRRRQLTPPNAGGLRQKKRASALLSSKTERARDCSRKKISGKKRSGRPLGEHMTKVAKIAFYWRL